MQIHAVSAEGHREGIKEDVLQMAAFGGFAVEEIRSIDIVSDCYEIGIMTKPVKQE